MRMGVLSGVVLTAALLVGGCTQVVSGSPVVAVRPPAPGSLFEGDLPSYGQKWSDEENASRAYLRALRRIDPCGMVATLQELGAVERMTGDMRGCLALLKIPGKREYAYVSVRPTLADISRDVVVFRVGGTPVYSYQEGGCLLDVPIPIGSLPGAPKLQPPLQPVLNVYVSDPAGSKCAMAPQMLAPMLKLKPSEYPMRSATSAYPIALAERDPCEIVGEYPGLLGRTDFAAYGGPFTCSFELRASTFYYNLSLTTHIEAQSDGYTRETADGVDYFYKTEQREYGTACAGTVLLGELPGDKDVRSGTYDKSEGRPDRMAIDISGSSPNNKANCDSFHDMLRKAVALFKNSAR